MFASRIRTYATEPPMMTIVRKLLKEAMKSGDSTTKNTLRDVISAVKNANIEKPESLTSDIKLHELLQKLVSTRAKSAEEYLAGQRKELADKEQAEIKVLDTLLNRIKVATPEDIEKKLTDLMSSLKIDSLPEKSRMGTVMSELKKMDLESVWNTSQRAVASIVQKKLGIRKYSTMSHENPLGLPRRSSKPQVGKRSVKGVKNVILVSSGKGGVGKSTVSINLAQALFEHGHATGILDADIFGPSIPTMLNLNSEPKMKNGMLLPLMNYGLKAMSMGFLIPEGKAVAWRGLLVQKALQQLLFEVDWGTLDYLIVDMPPGTGDVQLTIAQQLQVQGAIVVSTPQDIALIDAVRGIDMLKKVGTPIYGLVQNMSVFVCPHCHHSTSVFGNDGALKEAENRGIEILANIPLNAVISQAADAGKPVVLDASNPCSKIYMDFAAKIIGMSKS